MRLGSAEMSVCTNLFAYDCMSWQSNEHNESHELAFRRDACCYTGDPSEDPEPAAGGGPNLLGPESVCFRAPGTEKTSPEQ